jgi:hypothetical protein
MTSKPVLRLAAGAAALVLCALGQPASARIWHCENEAGQTVLRDVSCKRGETERAQEEGNLAAVTPPPAERRAPAPKVSMKLTEPLVREVAGIVSGAFNRRDTKQLLSVVAADAVFELECRLPQGIQIMRMNREEYAARLREAFKLADYTRNAGRGEIVMSPGGQHAEIVESVQETFLIQNQWRPVAARSRWSVEIREGRPQVTMLRSVITPPQ